MANFPDLNDDGKVTRADVLKGRGVFKKGGKVKKKMKQYANGGSIDDDVRARAMAAMAGRIEDETGKTSSIRRNTETGELYDTEMPKPRAVAKKVSKLSMPDFSNEDMDRMGLNESMNEMPKSLRAPGYTPPSVVKTINKKNVTKPTPRSPGRMVKEESDLAMTSPMEDKGRRLMRDAGIGFKSGGKVSKADMQKAGFYDKDKTKTERQNIVKKVTTKPQRVAIVEKAFSTKNMKSGGAVSSASKRADGCAVRGKTRA